VKWFTRLFGKRKSSAVSETPATAAKPAETPSPEPAAAPESDASTESATAESATAEPTAAAETASEEAASETVEAANDEEPAETAPADEPAELPAGPAISTLDREREAALLSESSTVEELPAAPAVEESAAGTKSVEPPTFSAGTPVAAEPAAAPEPAAATVAAVVDAPAAGEEGPFGPGSAKPLPDGSAPGEEFTVKGKRSSKLFHTAQSPYFGRTKADVWFKTPADAESAGFSAWNHKKKAAAK
jgi:hypothetical protein